MVRHGSKKFPGPEEGRHNHQMPTNLSDLLANTSEATLLSLANRLNVYSAELEPDEYQLLLHVLLSALPPHERVKYISRTELFSTEDIALLEMLSAGE